jgi:hypothetical protein
MVVQYDQHTYAMRHAQEDRNKVRGLEDDVIRRQERFGRIL